MKGPLLWTPAASCWAGLTPLPAHVSASPSPTRLEARYGRQLFSLTFESVLYARLCLKDFLYIAFNLLNNPEAGSIILPH